MEQYIIIGNGVAAAACIEGIRSIDRKGKITVISEENHPVYCRPLISYYLEEKTDIARMMYRNNEFYDRMVSTVLYGKSAVKIDKVKQTVIVDDGTVLPFTKLCAATGSSPFVPTFNGLESVPQKFNFMTLDDAQLMKKAINKYSKVLIIGAGLIGLKCAEGLMQSVGNITVCDLSEHILSSILDNESAAQVQKHLESKGIRFMLSDSVIRFDGNTAMMKSGRKTEFDILVLAVGVRANTGLLRDIGAEVNRGIIVNEKAETCISGIYACGDCAEGYDASLGSKRVLALMPNAYHQGFCAGVNMAGGDKIYDNAIPMNSLGLFGMHIMTAGTCFDQIQGGSVYRKKGPGQLKKLFIRDGVMTGFILIGETSRAGIYTAMVRNRTPLDSINFEMMREMPTTAALPKEIRGKMFGGVV